MAVYRKSEEILFRPKSMKFLEENGGTDGERDSSASSGAEILRFCLSSRWQEPRLVGARF